MDIERSGFVAYAYTVKNLGSEMDADYTPFFDRLSKYDIKVEFKVKEFDKHGKSHFHGILYLPKGFWRKRIMVHGYHIKLVEVYNKEGWIKYIHKDVHWEDYEDEDELIEMPTRSLFKPIPSS